MNKLVAALAASVLVLSGCSTAAPASTTPPAVSEGTLKIIASSTLKTPLNQLVADYNVQQPKVRVQVVYADPSSAAQQVAAGGADLYATAEAASMERAVTSGVVTDATFYARNQLNLIVKPYNPDKITGLNQTLEDKRLIVCAPTLACGTSYQEVLKEYQSDVTITPVSQETSVNTLLEKVASGQADAAVAFGTDAKPFGNRLTSLTLPYSDVPKALLKYPIARVTSSHQPELARSFISYCVSKDAEKILRKLGFGVI